MAEISYGLDRFRHERKFQPGYTLMGAGGYAAGTPRKVGGTMEIVLELLRALATLVVLGLIVVVLAGLFMIIFGIATGIDDRIQS